MLAAADDDDALAVVLAFLSFLSFESRGANIDGTVVQRGLRKKSMRLVLAKTRLLNVSAAAMALAASPPYLMIWIRPSINNNQSA